MHKLSFPVLGLPLLAVLAACAPNSIGVLVSQATGNTIGGTTPEERNIISGNSNSGIAFESGASSNTIQGNYIGLKIDGASALANLAGISVFSSSAHSNQIGGVAAGAGNVVSGNTQNGIQLYSFANNNIVEGNIVGLNAAGTAAIPNSNGISLFDRANSNRIGGSAAGAGNVSSGNFGSGVILIDGAQNNTIEGNKLGTATGTRQRLVTNCRLRVLLSLAHVVGTGDPPSTSGVSWRLTDEVPISRGRRPFWTSPT